MKITDFSKSTGRVAVVTGAASGIGKAIAELFSANGMKVVVTDLQDKAGQAVVDGIRAAGGDACYCHVNVQQEVEVQAAMRTAVDTYGKLHVVVNNAGIGTALHPVHEFDSEQFKRVTEINYLGTFYGMKHGVQAMLDSKAEGCAIINIASAAALIQSGNYTCYNASKAAVIALSKEAGLDYAKHDITVNTICPGVIDTPIYSKLAPEQLKRSLAKCPMGRFGQPEEIAEMALFLASDMARFITGTVIPVDGGMSVGPYVDFQWETPDPRQH